MNFQKLHIEILLPGLVVVGAIFLNVANAHLLLLIWVLFSLWEGRGSQSRMEPKILAMLLISVWITLAQFWSGVGSIGWFTTWTFLALPMAYVGWQLHSRRHPSTWPFMQHFLGLLGSLLAIWGIFQVAALDYTRAVGPLSDPNAYGCLLNLLWFPLFTCFLSSKHEHTVKIYGIVLMVIQLALITSGSRTASLIWVLLFATIALWKWKVVSRARIVFICAIAIGNYLLYSLHSGHLSVSSYEAAVSMSHTSQAAQFPRLLMWQSTIRMWFDAPVLGGGLGSWNYIYPAYRIAGETGTAGYFAHNDYLQLLQEGGIALFVLFVGLCGSLYVSGIRKMATRTGLEGIENLGLLAGVAAVILHATVNFSFYLIYINTLTGIYLGRVTLAPSQPFRQESDKKSIALSKSIKAVAIAVIVVNGFHALLSSVGLAFLRADSVGWNMVHSVAPRYSPYPVAALLASIRPSDTDAQRYIAGSLGNEIINNQEITMQQARELCDEILYDYDLMRKQNKYDAAIPAKEAEFLLDFIKRYGPDPGKLSLARDLLQESLRKDPSRADSAILLGQSYVEVGQIQVAYTILADMIPKVWRKRDRMIVEAEMLKMRMPQHTGQLSDLQQELRGMRVNCGSWQCGVSYSKLEKSARQTLDNLKMEDSSDSK